MQVAGTMGCFWRSCVFWGEGIVDSSVLWRTLKIQVDGIKPEVFFSETNPFFIFGVICFSFQRSCSSGLKQIRLYRSLQTDANESENEQLFI